MICTEDFVAAVEVIAQSMPVYRTGGTGADGTCDCIGLVMGAMYMNGHGAYEMHSSNYFARFETDELQQLKDPRDLKTGCVVYKARSDQERLHERYQPGGRYDTGDPLDYYHAGVVVCAEPLCIVHCTSANGVNGIARETTAVGWTHFGSVRGVTEDGGYAQEKAVVWAEKGKTVNLRVRPDGESPVTARIPLGETAVVHERANGWAKVTACGATGYMMTDYLKLEQQDVVSIPRQTLKAVMELLKAWI